MSWTTSDGLLGADSIGKGCNSSQFQEKGLAAVLTPLGNDTQGVIPSRCDYLGVASLEHDVSEM